MYDQPVHTIGSRPIAPPNPPHLETANMMAREVLNYPPELQNEMLAYLRKMIDQEQYSNIQAVEKTLVHLKEQYNILIGNSTVKSSAFIDSIGINSEYK